MILSVEKLTLLNKDELDQVMVRCWKDGNKRFNEAGIYDVVIEVLEDNSIKLNFSCNSGDPLLIVEYTQEIDRVPEHNYEFTLKIPDRIWKKVLKRIGERPGIYFFLCGI